LDILNKITLFILNANCADSKLKSFSFVNEQSEDEDDDNDVSFFTSLIKIN
jgi:hypothetical protein